MAVRTNEDSAMTSQPLQYVHYIIVLTLCSWSVPWLRAKFIYSSHGIMIYETMEMCRNEIKSKAGVTLRVISEQLIFTTQSPRCCI